MKWISTTIKRVWLDKILSGEKVIEYKCATGFWDKRLLPLMHTDEEIRINFLCGRVSYKFKVVRIEYRESAQIIDSKDCWCGFYEIHLGGRIE